MTGPTARDEFLAAFAAYRRALLGLAAVLPAYEERSGEELLAALEPLGKEELARGCDALRRDEAALRSVRESALGLLELLPATATYDRRYVADEL